MTAPIDIVNRALQEIGTRTTVASLGENSNEANQANLALIPVRDQLLRMAPWNCASNYANLVLITATPGTPENVTQNITTWQKGIPPPPWAYEYQYPQDCLRPLSIIPQFTTGFASGVPITTAITGGAPSFWLGPPQKYKVGIDQFFMATTAAVVSGGSGYNVGDTILLGYGPVTSPPIGGPATLTVTAAPAGVVSTVSVVNQIASDVGTDTNPGGGSYFAVQSGTQSQSLTSGTGTGFTCTLGGWTATQLDQRVILSNQETAMMVYLRRVVDPNVMDDAFIGAWVAALGAKLCASLTGDKALANQKLAEANSIIVAARTMDGNEGLTINDVTPDWMRTRGIFYPSWETTPNQVYDWGPLLAMY